MPYSPGVSDHSGEIWAKGIESIGNSFSDAIKKYEEDKKQRQFNTGVFDALKQSGQVSPEALEKWDSWNKDKQGGFLAGQMRSATEKHQQQQIALEKQKVESQAALNKAHADYFSQFGGQPGIQQVQNPAGGSPLNFYKGPRGWSLIPGQTGKGPKDILAKELPKYGLTPDDMGNLDFKSMDFVEEANKTYVVGKAGSKSFKIPKERWDQLATIYKNTPADTPQTSGVKPPAEGEVRQGYKFLGGDPSDPESWEQQ